MRMDTVLILITGLSLALAGVMSLLVWTMVREERLRSNARVAALEELAADVPPPQGVAPYRRAVAAGPGRAAKATAGDLPLRAAASHTPDLFAGPASGRSWGPRIALAAGVMAVLAGVGFSLLEPRDAISPAPSAPPAPLELLTLRHATSPGSLTVSGIVRNPGGGAPLRGIRATAYAMSADGTVLASARAPIDVVTFGPGEESPFQVEVAVAAPVVRYRVGFRHESGQVVAHVDRRGDSEAVAQK